jgi:hypothetical protein
MGGFKVYLAARLVNVKPRWPVAKCKEEVAHHLGEAIAASIGFVLKDSNGDFV